MQSLGYLSVLELPEFQNSGISNVLSKKKMLLAYDTGLGKSYIAGFIIRALVNRNPEKKHICVLLNESLKQFPADISKTARVTVSAFSSTRAQFKDLLHSWKNSTVICLSFECFQRENVCKFLYENIEDVESIIIDEAHHVSSWDVSNRAFMLRALAQYVEYVVELTATPITSNSKQFYKLMNILSRDLSYKRESDLNLYNKHYLKADRQDYNLKGDYKVSLELVNPMVHQLGKIKGNIFEVIKGRGAVNQSNALIKLLRERRDKKVIVYIHYHETRKYIEECLEENSIDFCAVHGKLPKHESRAILKNFNSNNCGVLLTSLSESINIESDTVILYEYTTKVKQIIGRAHRGLNPKALEIIFILTRETAEIDFFMKYIYYRSLTIQRLLGKDVSEFLSIKEQLEEYDVLDYTGGVI